MTNLATMRDIGAYLRGKYPFDPVVITAGAGSDGAQVDGDAIDRRADVQHPVLSAKVLISSRLVAVATETGTILANAQHAINSSGPWTDYDDKDESTGQSFTLGTTGSTASQDINTVSSFDLDLSGARRWIRIQVTPSLNTTATDTLAYAGVVVMGPGNVIP